MIRDFSITRQNLPFLTERMLRLDPTRHWVCNVTEKKTKRSRPQNARYWAFMTDFGAYLGYTKDEMHDLCRMKFLSERVTVGNAEMTKLLSTPKQSTKEFSHYCEMCEMWASQLGFIWEGR